MQHKKVDLRLRVWTNDGDSKKLPGHYPLKFELYVDTNRWQEGTGYWVRPEQFDQLTQKVINHPKANFWNALLKKSFDKYTKKIEHLTILEDAITGPVVFEKVVTRKGFFDYSKKVRPGKETQTVLNRIQRFLGREPSFREVASEDFLRSFSEWHIIDQELDSNTLNNSLRCLRKILGVAKKERIIYRNPLSKKDGGAIDIPEYVQPETIFLVTSERERFYKLFLKYKAQYDAMEAPAYDGKYKALVYFELAVYTGLRTSDWYEFNPETRVQEDGFIRVRAVKNQNWVVLPISPALRLIIEEIRKVGPFTTDNSDTNTYLRELAKEAQVNKDITTHKGRHSFGHLCACLGFTLADTAHYMGITEKVAKVYYHMSGEIRKERAMQLSEVQC